MSATALALAACGSSGGNSGGSGGGKASSSLDNLSPAALQQAAAKEGSLTWYTTFADDDIAPFLKEFNKTYPKIKVNPLRLSADKIPARVITEQRGGKYNADVVSGDSPQLAQLLQAGALAPYTPKDLAPLPSGLDLPNGYEGVVYVVTTVVAYNPTVVQQKHLPAPSTWDDLTKPQWKGQFSIDPGAVNWYDSLVRSMGHDKALALLKKLGNNTPRFVESHTQALTQVQAGEPAGAATAYGYKAASEKKKTPKQLEFVNDNPLPSSLNLVDLVKNAPHPAAARLFIDWIVSKAGQQAVVDVTNHTSLRTDVQNDRTVWDPNKWKPAWGKPILSSSEYNTELQEMKSALHAP
jgi:iron(III) transport system substrate-binding protein